MLACEKLHEIDFLYNFEQHNKIKLVTAAEVFFFFKNFIASHLFNRFLFVTFGWFSG
jgi:hypothetical protein